jgi:hypothetical protein
MRALRVIDSGGPINDVRTTEVHRLLFAVITTDSVYNLCSSFIFLHFKCPLKLIEDD